MGSGKIDQSMYSDRQNTHRFDSEMENLVTDAVTTHPTPSTQAAGNQRNTIINSHDDATWILTSAFIIFTMQSGK